ncbi:MAG: hypothetical protein NFCOHLIN_02489 [Gammaproteobacteria bacterium]|nr:hypothetical protein [Gammaproteobacteria bacterium]
MSVSGRIELPDPTIIIPWTQILLDSHARLTGGELIARSGDALEEAERLFRSPFVVASHDTAVEPVLNYGNRAALDLWELPWERFVRTPSQATAETDRQEERRRVLEQVGRLGYITGYFGVRVSATGRRFRIHDVTIWDLTDTDGWPVGQAATFRHWTDE